RPSATSTSPLPQPGATIMLFNVRDHLPRRRRRTRSPRLLPSLEWLEARIDPATIVPGLSINNVAVVEGDAGTSDATFAVSLSEPSSRTVTVHINTAGSSATSGVDFDAITSQALTFSPGQTVKALTVKVRGDTVDEPNERFFV